MSYLEYEIFYICSFIWFVAGALIIASVMFFGLFKKNKNQNVKTDKDKKSIKGL